MAKLFRYSSGYQRWLFGDKEIDRTSGLDLYDFEARAYDPALGRFRTADKNSEQFYPISQYSYCINNPLIIIDPSGNLAISADEELTNTSLAEQNNKNSSFSTAIEAGASALTIGLIADDASGVGFVDDIAIPFIWGAAYVLMSIDRYINGSPRIDNSAIINTPQPNRKAKPAPPKSLDKSKAATTINKQKIDAS